MGDQVRGDLEQIFMAGLGRVDPYRMIMDHVRMDGDTLRIAFEGERHDIALSDYSRIIVIGAGKATAAMAKALEEILGERITDGLISVKYGHVETLSRIRTIESAHPVPDDNSIDAAMQVAEMVESADENTLVITLVSGGGSALLASPASFGDITLSLADKQAVTTALLASGATINEINTIRKHLSGIKGGRLLQRISPARSVNFILSDVVGDRLDTIASGMTAADDTTFADALAIIDHYGITPDVPTNVIRMLQKGADGEIAETPKPGDASLETVTNVLIGTNAAALVSARDKAVALGYDTVTLTSQVTGEAKELAKFMAGIGRDVHDRHMLATPPACIIIGGETTVTVTGDGLGGRNQEMALAFLVDMLKDRRAHLHFLSASTDGNDGPTDATGAFADLGILEAAEREGLSIHSFMKNNDSYHFFNRLGMLLKTGPTNTNVCDLHILIVTDDQ